jgi:hypothetical protein
MRTQDGFERGERGHGNARMQRDRGAHVKSIAIHVEDIQIAAALLRATDLLVCIGGSHLGHNSAADEQLLVQFGQLRAAEPFAIS